MLEKYETPEDVFLRLQTINDEIKLLSEEKTQLMNEFFDKYQDNEFPTIDVEGKQKYFRVYEVDGRFIYNVKYELGLRVKPIKMYQPEGEK